MSKLVTWQVSVSGSGDGVSAFAWSPSNPIKNAAAPAVGCSPVALSSGFNSVAIPTGALGVAIDWPPGTAATCTLKGITGDSGSPQSTQSPLLLSWDGVSPAPTTIGLTMSAGLVAEFYWR